MDRNGRNSPRWLPYAALASIVLGLLALALHRAPHEMTAAQRSEGGPLAPERSTRGSPAHAARPRGASGLHGAVYGKAHSALAGATVCASCTRCDLQLAESAPSCTRSEPDGGYTLADLRAGDYFVSAAARGYAPGVGNGGAPIAMPALDARGHTSVDIELKEGGAEVTGAVVDVTGGPVAGATVQASFGSGALTYGGFIAQTAVSDEQGRFVLSCAEGPVGLVVAAEGYAPGQASRIAPASDVELVVTPSSSIRGLVVSDEGRPLPDLRVVAKTSLVPMRSATTDSAGQFSIAGLIPGVYQLRASGEGWLGDYPATVTLSVADNMRDIVIAVRKGAVIRGTVLTGDASPCADSQVHLGPRVRDFSLPPLDASGDAQGKVLFEAVPAGTYEVSVACMGSDFEPMQVLEVGGDDRSGLTWKVNRQLRVEGRVVDRRSRPVSQLLLELVPESGTAGEPRALPTRPDGAFAFVGLAAGGYIIRAADLVKPMPVQLRDRSLTDLTLVADAVGDIVVRVTDASGKPVDGLAVSAMSAEGPPTNPPEERGNGLYRLGPLAAGAYAVHVGDGINPRVRAGGPSATAAVAGGETTTVDVRYGGYSGRITGRVLDESGAPIENVWVQASPSEPVQDTVSAIQQMKIVVEAKRSLSDAQGRFELTGLSEQGAFVVSAERPLGGGAKLDGVRAGSSVDVVLTALGSLSGTAVDAEGRPIVHLSLQVANQSTGQHRAEMIFDPAGNWRIEDVTPGSVQLIASDPNQNVAIVTVDLSPKQKLENLRLTLAPHHTAVAQEQPDSL